MTETCATDIAYIAGLLDSDGYVCLHPMNIGTPWQGYSFKVGIVNRHLDTLQWVQSIFGGKITERTRNRRSPHSRHWSPTFDWVIMDSQVLRNFLQTVYPYMRIKKEQAKLVMEFLETVQDRTKQYRLPAEVKQRREELYAAVKELNKVPSVVCSPKGVN